LRSWQVVQTFLPMIDTPIYCDKYPAEIFHIDILLVFYYWLS